MTPVLPRGRTATLARLFLLFIFSGFAFVGFAQTEKASAVEKRLQVDKRIAKAVLNPELATPSLIKPAAPIPAAEALNFLKTVLQPDAAISFRNLRTDVAPTGLITEKVQQYYNGIKVQHGVYSIVSRNNNAEVFAGSFIDLHDVNTVPAIDEARALQFAKAFTGASKFAWDQAREARDAAIEPLRKQLLNAEYEKLLPVAQLVIVKDYDTRASFDIAYRFDIYTADPMTRGFVYVNAHTGKIMLYDKIIKHLSPDHKREAALSGIVPEVAGLIAMNSAQLLTAQNSVPPPPSVQTALPTRYAGIRLAGTKQVTGNDPSGNGMLLMSSTGTPFIPGSAAYVLIDDANHSQAEQTFDLNGVGGLPVSAPVYGTAKSFTDVDNNWTLTEHKRSTTSPANEAENDDYAFDAHWGAGIVYKYWKNIHARSSFDNLNTAIKSYVHYGPAYDNAFWNGSVMTYGDGSYQNGAAAGFAPLTSLDVCGHEIGHGVCSFTSDLVYAGESGAMNEGFSDVWAACIENYAIQNIDNTLISNATTNPNGFKIWSIGEQIDANDTYGTAPLQNYPSSDPMSTALRYMDDPNRAGDPGSFAEKTPASGTRRWKNPNCTPPNLANDQCGVHTNSGVLNHLFYYLVSGSGGPGTVNTLNTENTTGALDGQPFNVTGIGFGAAERIMYQTELMLTPNATFLEARNAGVTAAEVLYGKCSNEWRQTIIAWHAVAVGSSNDTAQCSNLALFTAATDADVSESTAKSAVNCTAATIISPLGLNVLAPGSATPINVTITPAGTATINKDYTLSASAVTYGPNQSGLRPITISIYNDAETEADETIILAINANNGAGYNKDTTITITIRDDDFVPTIGDTRITLLTENFDATTGSALPASWVKISRLGAPLHHWYSVPAGSYTGFTTRAAAVTLTATAGLPVTPSYDPSAPGNVILRTPLINAATYSDLKLNFSYAAGGEPDGNVPAGALDYGRILYSFDNVTFVPLSDSAKRYALTPARIADSVMLPRSLAGKSFYIGFEWSSDDNVAAPPSFIIDDVILTAGRQKVETQAGDGVSEIQYSGKDIYYMSAQDGQVIARVSAPSQDLGCVTASVTAAGNGAAPGTLTHNGTTYQRANKVIQISPATANTTATYSFTLYATAQELSGFTAAALKVLKVRDGVSYSGTIANGDAQVINPVYTNFASEGYATYSGTATGFSQFLLVQASVVVPVRLIAFDAAAQNNKYIRVSWTATNESGAGAYAVERAVQGSVDFKEINNQTIRGSGADNNYVFNDNTAVPGVVYQYRLKTTENGNISYSNVELASLDSKGIYAEIAPNPSTGLFRITIGGARGMAEVRVNDAAGRVLMSRKVQTDAGNTFPIDLTKNAKGVYTLQIQMNEETMVYKLIVQ